MSQTHRKKGQTRTRANQRLKAQRIAITGCSSWHGEQMVRRLLTDATVKQILLLDVRFPTIEDPRIVQKRVDLTLPNISSSITKHLQSHKIDTVIHLAFLQSPTTREEWAHELEDVGTMHLITAIQQSAVTYVLSVTTGLVYGAWADNEICTEESAVTRGIPGASFIQNKINAERQLMQLADNKPALQLCILRPAHIAGQAKNGFFIRYAQKGIAPTQIGYDPQIQLLHDKELIHCMSMALQKRINGIYNLASPGFIPLRNLMRRLDRRFIPTAILPKSSMLSLLWHAQCSPLHPALQPLLQYPCLLNTDKFSQATGYSYEQDINHILDLITNYS